ncbi:MAG: LamG domain-containing protein, partial [Phycisphaerales bacterium]|nr:LamG domain-containing protein [Phycisphaerales bacterium]
ANPNNWQLAVREGRVIMTLDEFDLYSVGGSVSLATNKWNHVAGTWDGTQIRLYVNGVADGSPVSRAAPIGTDTRPVYIGGRNGMTDITNGTVDDVRFYNRALTADEIADLAKVAPTLTTWKAVTPP